VPPMTSPDRSRIVRAIILGGLAVAVLDGLDAVVAYKIVLGFDPVPIYQFVASGLLGPSAFSGGAATALLGLAVHFLVAFSAAAAYVLSSLRWPALRDRPVPYGLAFGIAVFAFMSWVVTPLSRIPSSPFSLPLFLNGLVGHALLVGLPIAVAARRVLGATRSAGTGSVHPAHLADARP
jgi:hypothetical protein